MSLDDISVSLEVISNLIAILECDAKCPMTSAEVDSVQIRIEGIQVDPTPFIFHKVMGVDVIAIKLDNMEAVMLEELG